MPRRLNEAQVRQMFYDAGYELPANFHYVNNKTYYQVIDKFTNQTVRMSFQKLKYKMRQIPLFPEKVRYYTKFPGNLSGSPTALYSWIYSYTQPLMTNLQSKPNSKSVAIAATLYSKVISFLALVVNLEE